MQFYLNGKKKAISLKTKSKNLAYPKSKEVLHEYLGYFLHELLDDWNNYHMVMRSRRYKEDMKHAISHFSDWLKMVALEEDTPIDQLKKQHLLSYMAYMYQTLKWNQSTVGRQMRTLQAIFNWGYDKDKIKNKVFRKIKLPSSKQKLYFLQHGDIVKLLEAASENPLHQAWIEFLLITGCRTSEIKNLRWS